MSFAIWLADQTLSISNQAVFFSSNEILGNTSDVALQAAAAVITSFDAQYVDGVHGISELEVSVTAEVGTSEGSNGVWVTPVLALRNEQSNASVVSVGIALLVTYANLPKPTTTLWSGTTALMSPPVAAGALIVGALSQPAQWLTAGLSGFDLTFSDQSDHWFHDMACYLGVSPISGAQLALQGQASIADDSQHWGIAPAKVTALAFASDADGYPFLQSQQTTVSFLGPANTSASWSTASFTPASYGAFLTGFTLSMGSQNDFEISKISVGVDATTPTFADGVMTMGLQVRAAVLVAGITSLLQVANVSYVALVMAPAPSTPRS